MAQDLFGFKIWHAGFGDSVWVQGSGMLRVQDFGGVQALRMLSGLNDSTSTVILLPVPASSTE